MKTPNENMALSILAIVLGIFAATVVIICYAAYKKLTGL
jgi:hypothetical protein